MTLSNIQSLHPYVSCLCLSDGNLTLKGMEEVTITNSKGEMQTRTRTLATS